jgi:hypothetical protein
MIFVWWGLTIWGALRFLTALFLTFSLPNLLFGGLLLAIGWFGLVKHYERAS